MIISASPLQRILQHMQASPDMNLYDYFSGLPRPMGPVMGQMPISEGYKNITFGQMVPEIQAMRGQGRPWEQYPIQPTQQPAPTPRVPSVAQGPNPPTLLQNILNGWNRRSGYQSV